MSRVTSFVICFLMGALRSRLSLRLEVAALRHRLSRVPAVDPVWLSSASPANREGRRFDSSMSVYKELGRAETRHAIGNSIRETTVGS